MARMDEQQVRADAATWAGIRAGTIPELEFHLREQEIRNQASIDALTGLGNRREFMEKITRMSKDGEKFSVVIFDIDEFKKFNDTWGHETGNVVLEAVGRTARRVEMDGEVFRLGGEEFYVLLPNDEGEDLVNVTQKVGNQFIAGWQEDVRLGEKRVGRITVSMGGGTIAEGETVEGFLDRIDQILYKAKRADPQTGAVGRQRAMVEVARGQTKEVSFRK